MTGSLLTAGEVAELLGVPKTWVYEQSRRERIPTVTLGRYRRYRRDAIEAWLERIEGGSVDRPHLAAERARGSTSAGACVNRASGA